MKKKIQIVVFVLILAFSFGVVSACDNNAAPTDTASVATARTAVENAVFSAVAQAALNTEAAAREHVEDIVSTVVAGMNVTTVVTGVFTAAVAQTASVAGSNGSFVFTVVISSGTATDTTASKTLMITRTPYVTDSNAAVATARTAIESAVFSAVSQSNINTRTAADAHVEAVIATAVYGLGVTTAVGGVFAAAIAATESAAGVDGSYIFTVAISRGAATDVTDAITLTIIHTPYAPRPGMPQNVKATSGSEQLFLYWSAPASDGGSAIIAFEVSYDNGSTWTTVSNTAGRAAITGLLNDIPYTLSIRAVNANGSGAEVTVTATPRNTVSLPVLLYHRIFTANRPPVDDYELSAAEFRSDLEYLVANGYTTVTAYQLAKWVSGEGGLPARPIILTFDDGDICNYTITFPLLQEFNLGKTSFLVGNWVGRLGYINVNQIWTMATSGLVEFGSHSWDLHTWGGGTGWGHMLMAPGETVEQYSIRILNDVTRMNQFFTTLENATDGLGINRRTLAYPYGRHNTGITSGILTGAGYNAIFTSISGLNTFRVGEPAGLMYIQRINRNPGPTQAFMSRHGI